MHQQLAAWGRQAACVRAGNLQLSCELGGTNQVGHARLSPGADRVAFQFSSNGRSVAVLPVTGTNHSLPFLRSKTLPDQTLTPPGSGSDQLLRVEWSPTGQHLVLLTSQSNAAGSGMRVSTYRGALLVGSFVEPLAGGDNVIDLHITDDAATMLLSVGAVGQCSRVLACTVQGTVTARHLSAPTAQHAAALGNGRLLTAPTSGESLFIYSASCAQQISLSRPPARYLKVSLSGRGATASVLLISRDSAVAHVLVVVDLVQCCVRHCVEVREDYKDSSRWTIAQGARSVALTLEDIGKMVVFATAGEQEGKQLWEGMCGGCDAAWDDMGNFLALVRFREVLVLAGASGTPLASMRLHPKAVLSSLGWLPDSAGLVVLQSEYLSPPGLAEGPVAVYESLCVMKFPS